MKKEKEEEHAYSLKTCNSEGHEKIIPLRKKKSADLPPIKFKYYSLQTKKTEKINFYDCYEHLEKFGFDWKDNNLAFKYTVEFSSEKLIIKMTLRKNTRQKNFIDESRIWNFSSEKIEAANVRSYISNYMSDENLIKTFWKISNNNPVIDFTKEIMVHKDNFTKFVDKRITKSNDNILYSSNIQFETIMQPRYGDRSILYKLIVNHSAVSTYYHERRDTNFLQYFDICNVKKNLTLRNNIYLYIKKDTGRMYISRDYLDLVFQINTH